MSPRPTTLAVSALVLWALVVVVPLGHLGLSLAGAVLAFAALPLAILVLMFALPGRAALSHAAFPLAFMPLFIAHPEVVGPRIYSGATGIVAFLAVVAAAVAYFIAATPRLPQSRARPEPLVMTAAVIALAPTFALALPALGADNAPWAGLTALLLGPLVAWWLVARRFAHEVALPALDPSLRTRALYHLRERARPRTSGLVLAVVFALIALALVLTWMLWSPR